MIQNKFIILSLEQFGSILRIPFIGQSDFTTEWDLSSLSAYQEPEGPYHTELPTPDDIHGFLQFERVDSSRILRGQLVDLPSNRVLTKEVNKDMKHWEELIRKNVFGLGGNRDYLSACLAHMMSCIVAEKQYNLAYFVAKRIEFARATPKVNLPYGMLLTWLFRQVVEWYPHLDNGIYDIVEERRPHKDPIKTAFLLFSQNWQKTKIWAT
ncbi:hypothetical protein Tco_1029317 [Tanacetum coccineum]|uniref:Uncharacterized protein n=1 Tax=Tanacetum coccineum TaxID=301880 RepID=A0ABQ5G3F5_9ASTR